MPLTPRRLLARICHLAALASVVQAQLTLTVTVNGSATTDSIPYIIQPSGVQEYGSRFGGSVPLICTKTCYAQELVYGGCFLDYKVPTFNNTPSADDLEVVGTFDYSTEICTEALCDTVGFQVFAQCMNCIIANGGEGERSIYTGTYYTEYDVDKGAAATERIDADRARAWLGNVTDFCAAQGIELEGVTELTATPTTTGPYTTTWGRSETVNIPEWTEYAGLPSFISSIEADIVSGYKFGLTATPGQPYPTATPSTTSGQQDFSSTTGAAPSAASASSGAAHRGWMVDRALGGGMIVFGAAVLVYM